MNEIHTDPVLDMKTLFAIYTDPDGVSIIGAWNGVKMLAASDPEGCVRMTSGLPMDTAMLAGLFHCSECIVQKTLALFEKLRLLTVTDGLIRIAGGRNDSVTKRIATRKPINGSWPGYARRNAGQGRNRKRNSKKKTLLPPLKQIVTKRVTKNVTVTLSRKICVTTCVTVTLSRVTGVTRCVTCVTPSVTTPRKAA